MKKINKTYHANVNVNLMVKNVTQIKFGIAINGNASAKKQEKMFGILLHAVVKMIHMQEALLMNQWLCMMKL